MGKLLVIIMIGSLFASAYYAVGIVLLCLYIPYAIIWDLNEWNKSRRRKKLKDQMTDVNGDYDVLAYYKKLDELGLHYSEKKLSER